MSNQKEKKTRQELKEWRKEQCVKYWSMGYTNNETAKMLKISESTVKRDVKSYLEEDKDRLHRHLEEGLPRHYTQSMTGLQHVLKQAWSAFLAIKTDEDVKLSDKVAIMSLIKECHKSIAELANNGQVVQQAIEFTRNANKKLDNINSSNNAKDKAKDESESESEESLYTYDDTNAAPEDTAPEIVKQE